jgi:hypothetical protein
VQRLPPARPPWAPSAGKRPGRRRPVHPLRRGPVESAAGLISEAGVERVLNPSFFSRLQGKKNGGVWSGCGAIGALVERRCKPPRGGPESNFDGGQTLTSGQTGGFVCTSLGAGVAQLAAPLQTPPPVRVRFPAIPKDPLSVRPAVSGPSTCEASFDSLGGRACGQRGW